MTGNVICGAVGLAHAATRGHNGLSRIESVNHPGDCLMETEGGSGGENAQITTRDVRLPNGRSGNRGIFPRTRGGRWWPGWGP